MPNVRPARQLFPRHRERSEAIHSSRGEMDCFAPLAMTEERAQPPSAAVVPRESGVSSTPRLIDLIIDVSGILDPPSLVELRRTSHPPYNVEYGFATSRRDASGVLHQPSPSKEQRAQGRPGARCTRGLACKVHIAKTHTSIQVQRRASGLPCAMVLRLISCSPR
jgi:hypothetical protein